jgi:propanediol utilization protein
MTQTLSPPGLDRARIERIVREIVADRFEPRRPAGPSPLVVNTSARHVHISQEHLELLFGRGAELTPFKPLYQNGEFASEQTVDLVGPRRRILANVRILGPVRPATQIELAFTDAVGLGIDVPVRMSGNHEGTPGCLVLGPAGRLELTRGVIRAQRHVHMTPQDAAYFGVEAGDSMNLIIEHPTCATVLQGVIARVNPSFKLEVHIDTDEGNCCNLPQATSVRLEKAR